MKQFDFVMDEKISDVISEKELQKKEIEYWNKKIFFNIENINVQDKKFNPNVDDIYEYDNERWIKDISIDLKCCFEKWIKKSSTNIEGNYSEYLKNFLDENVKVEIDISINDCFEYINAGVEIFFEGKSISSGSYSPNIDNYRKERFNYVGDL